MTHNLVDHVEKLFKKGDKLSVFRARQCLFLISPLSKVVELYLHNNEGVIQSLDDFPMMRQIYDELPPRLLLKCSRKTLKSTLLSNIITLNMIRYNHYHHLYLGPNEKFTKYFSSNYLSARFRSPAVKRIVHGLRKDDVFEKILDDTDSSVLLGYASDDATRMRGPATDHNIHDEVQDMEYEMLPIVAETMSMSKYQREIFAGTPLTTNNTIHRLWKESNQLEWAFRCEPCNKWLTLTEEHEPVKMIRKQGLSCPYCGALVNTKNGLWVSRNPPPPGEYPRTYGFHLAQPILPHYNTAGSKEWSKIYTKVTSGEYNMGQIYNEVFGLSFDTGSRPITEEELRSLCVLGDMNTVFERRKQYLRVFCLGADWGVNMATSRTAAVMLGLTDNLTLEVFFAKIYKDFNYDDQIKDLAKRSNACNSYNAADSGPDPNRGIKLAEMTSPGRTQLVRYEASQFIQYQKIPKDAVDWRQYRWCFHRSDTLTFTYNLLKQKKILFPAWEHVSECMQDILNVVVEVKDGALRQELVYSHPEKMPDDFMHALNFAAVQAYVWAGDLVLKGPSTSNHEPGHYL